MGLIWRRWEYVVWIRDPMFPPDDEDYQFPAVFVIRAPSMMKALRWGDLLSESHCVRVGQPFLWSFVIKPETVDHSTVEIRYGHAATDEEIGW